MQTSIKQNSLWTPRGARMKSAGRLPCSSYFEEKKTDHVSIILNFRVEEYLIETSPRLKHTFSICIPILDTFPKKVSKAGTWYSPQLRKSAYILDEFIAFQTGQTQEKLVEIGWLVVSTIHPPSLPPSNF